jgi:hypothetical protein
MFLIQPSILLKHVTFKHDLSLVQVQGALNLYRFIIIRETSGSNSGPE